MKRAGFALVLLALTLALLAAVVPAGSPALVPAPKAISAGGAHTCGIRADGTLACWGEDSAGQLDEVPEGEFLSVSAGGTHTCAIRADGTLACWGEDSAGQLDEVPEGEFRAVSAGGSHTCAIRTGGELECWGEDSAGQVSGAPEEETPEAPYHLHHRHHNHHHHHHHHKDDPPPPVTPKFIAVGAGGEHTCVVDDDGELECWGEDSAGQLDEVPEGEFLSVSAGGTHTCGIRADGTLACWGEDSAGQLDEVPEGEFLSVSAGGTHTCAIRADGEATCWGNDDEGRVQPKIVGSEPPQGTVGVPYAHTLETTPEIPVPTFSLAAGQLPPGLALDAKGTLLGMPAKAGTFSFTVAAASGVVPDATREATMKIAPPPPPPETGLAAPTAGVNVNVETVEGTVRTKCPAGRGYTNLNAPTQLPIDCLVDATNGVVGLTTAKGSEAGTQSAAFWGGIFSISQKAGDNWIAGLRLAGRLKCERRKPARKPARARASRRTYRRSKRHGRKLWGSGKGSYRTSGNYGSATVRGTVWLVRDRCDNSTLFGVREGVVTVDDFVKDRTLSLYPGKQYVAKAAIPRLR